MRLTIELPPETERRLRERAAQDHRTPEELAAEIITRAFAPEVEANTAALEASLRAKLQGTPAERAARLSDVIDQVRADIARYGNPNATAIDKRFAYEDE